AFSKRITEGGGELGNRNSEVLQKAIDPWLRQQNVMNMNQVLPVLGQLAFLDPPAARTVLVNLIQQDLEVADLPVNPFESPETRSKASTLASNVLKLGGNTSLIANEFSKRVGEFALGAQAASLERVL